MAWPLRTAAAARVPCSRGKRSRAAWTERLRDSSARPVEQTEYGTRRVILPSFPQIRGRLSPCEPRTVVARAPLARRWPLSCLSLAEAPRRTSRARRKRREVWLLPHPCGRPAGQVTIELDDVQIYRALKASKESRPAVVTHV